MPSSKVVLHGHEQVGRRHLLELPLCTQVAGIGSHCLIDVPTQCRSFLADDQFEGILHPVFLEQVYGSPSLLPVTEHYHKPYL